MERHGNPIVVTTSLRAGITELETARRISDETGLPLVDRGKSALEDLLAGCGAGGAVVVESRRVIFTDGSVEFFFHPGMAGLRITELRRGKQDQMIAAMDLRPGQRVLDCTLGLGSDAIVAGYVVGENGRVVGLESSPVIAALVRHGMQNYDRAGRPVREAMHRVEVRRADHREVLKELPPGSFDVVYFDPMFHQPLVKSSGINGLRPLADHRPLTPGIIDLALRVAAKRVVAKDSRWSRRLGELGFTRFTGGKNSPVIYGIMAKE